MKLQINRTNLRLNPDSRKVIPRYLNAGNERSLAKLKRIMNLADTHKADLLNQVMQEFSGRYRNIEDIFMKHFESISYLLPDNTVQDLSTEKKLLIGSYFTMEYAYEAAAVFNPSVVEAPEQSGLAAGEKRVVISFRATGESHISSLIFKQAILDEQANIRFDPDGQLLCEGVVKHLSETSYSLSFPTDSTLSERVIFPVTLNEKNGIEDARFVQFTDTDGDRTYMATYTAYNGSMIMPCLIETKDFCHFRMSQMTGAAAVNKNLALFPRKINGQYAMLARIDGVNNFIMFSNDRYQWPTAELLQEPKYDWELVQIGNGGAPIETEKGWLVITHGVGPMRKYCLGASLFDINDPRIELGRLKAPFLLPNEDERHGYVPNVVYSCGSIVHGDKLFVPYAVSDHATSFATVNLTSLLHEILQPG
jgi:Predicted glycosylase